MTNKFFIGDHIRIKSFKYPDETYDIVSAIKFTNDKVFYYIYNNASSNHMSMPECDIDLYERPKLTVPRIKELLEETTRIVLMGTYYKVLKFDNGKEIVYLGDPEVLAKEPDDYQEVPYELLIRENATFITEKEIR